MTRVNQPSICYIALDVLNQDNGGVPPSFVFAGISSVLAPVAVYNNNTGFMYVPIRAGLTPQVWAPSGFFTSGTPAAGGDLFYIANLMPYSGASTYQYFWVGLTNDVLPVGTSDLGPDPPSNTLGLQYTLGGGTPAECFGPWGGTINSTQVHFGPF
jgi:hypothetical protein